MGLQHWVNISGVNTGGGTRVAPSNVSTNGGDDCVIVANGAMSEGAVLNVNTSEGNDTVHVAAKALSGGSVLNVDLGSGSDSLIINGQTELSAGEVATINVTCGAGADGIALSSTTAGKLIVQVSNFTAGVDAIDGGDFAAGQLTGSAYGSGVAGAAALLNGVFDLKLADTGTLVSVDGGTENGYAIGGKIYMTGSIAAPATLLVVQGVPTDASALDLDGDGV